jgi:HlyD family secretion protein
MKSRLQAIVWGVVGLAIMAAVALAFRPVPLEVDLGTVTRGALRVSVDAEGKTRIKERYVVSAPLGGQLQRVTLHPGDQVVAGKTTLAVIEPGDPGLLDARIRNQAEARVRATDASRQRAEAIVTRSRELHQLAASQLDRARLARAKEAISLEEYEAAETRERAASAELRAAEFSLKVETFEHEQSKAALIRLTPRNDRLPLEDRLPIISPIDGKVLRVFQESSAIVTAGARLLEIGDPADLEMEFDVLSTDAVQILPGAKVIVEHWGGSTVLEGRVRVVEPAAFLKISALGVEEQRVYVIADFIGSPDQRRSLGDAYRVEARIVTWEASDVLIVPAGALFRKQDQWATFVFRNGRARLTPVTVGRSNGLETEIREGLSAGDLVVLHPSDQISDGRKIQPR